MEGAQIGPYRILGDLGSGGMGKVYLAEVKGRVPGLADGCRVALKVIHPHLLETPGFFKRFLREAQIGKSVQQDNVVRCFDCDAVLYEGVQQNFLVMEYVEGQTLRELLDEIGRVPEELCRHIGREISKGLRAIHEAGIVHRDLKPENVLITPDHKVKIMDLGVARLQDEAIRFSRTGHFVGSVPYAAPEAFRGAGAELDGRADLHSLGVLLYELATGIQPYQHDDIRVVLQRIQNENPRPAGEVNAQLSPFFEELVHTLMAKDRKARFASASGLLHVLEAGEDSEWWQERVKALRSATKRPLRRIRIPRETELYGRMEELRRLRSAYESVKAGAGRVVLISGEAGVGKTRLVDAFVSEIQREGEDFNFLFGSYPPGGAATAAGAFSTAYREHFGTVGLEETLAKYMADCLLLVPAFSAVLRGTPVPSDAPPLDRESLQAVFVHATRALARERPTVILIDDLHFAPEEGLSIAASLAASIPDQRVLLIGTFRPGLPEDWAAGIGHLDHAARLLLGRLGPKDLVALLTDTLGSRRVAEGLSLLIAEKSDGNPFFVFEILNGLRESGRLVRNVDGTWAATEIIEDVQIPSSVLDLVRARISDLGEPERHLLELAACCGYEFDPEIVAEASDTDVVVALRRLGRIEHKHRLIRALGRRCTFDHHQVQEALYQGLLAPLRRRFHGLIADAIERREGGDPSTVGAAAAVDLVEHLFEAENGERARAYLDRALGHLEDGYLHDAAVDTARRALAQPGLIAGAERVRLLLRVAKRLGLLGRRTEEREALDEALELSVEIGDDRLRAPVLVALGRHGIEVARADDALTAYREAADIARSRGDQSLEAVASGGLGTAYARLGRLEEARRHHERQLEIAQAIGDRRSEAMANGSLGNVAWYLGRYEEARAYFERDCQITSTLGDPGGEAASAANLGVIERALGRFDEALALQSKALANFRKMGARRGEAICLNNVGNVFQDRGELDAAKSHHEDAIRLCQDIRDQHTEVNARRALTTVLFDTGRYDEAERELQVQERLCRVAGSTRIAMYVAQEQAHLAACRGRSEEAARMYTECLARAREANDRRRAALSLLELSCLRAGGGDTSEAESLLREAVVMAREHDIPDVLLIGTAKLAAMGAVSAAEALRLAEEQGSRLGHRRRIHMHFLLWRATGDRRQLVLAKRLLDHFVLHAPEAHSESMLKNVMLHREIESAWKALPPERAKRVEGEHGGEGE